VPRKWNTEKKVTKKVSSQTWRSPEITRLNERLRGISFAIICFSEKGKISMILIEPLNMTRGRAIENA
jgi:hypothetical protein